MASVTLQVRDVFPPTTSVGAYKRSNWTATQVPTLGTAPPGSADTAATVAADGTLTFASLTANTEYVAGAQISGTWTYRSFSSGADDTGIELGYVEDANASETTTSTAADGVAFSPAISKTVTVGTRPIVVKAIAEEVTNTGAGNQTHLVLLQDGVSLGNPAFFTPGAAGQLGRIHMERRLSLTPGTYTFSLNKKVSAGTGTYMSFGYKITLQIIQC